MLRSGLLVPVLAAGLFGVACEDKKPSSEPLRTDASTGADKYATADPKLAKALQAAASPSAGSEKGPPPDGIFAPGVADQRHPKGMPTKLDIVTEGSEPRVTLLSAVDASQHDAARASSYGPAGLEVATQLGPRSGIVIDFTLALGPAKKDEGGQDWLVANVKRALPAKDQLGQLAPGTDREIGSLEGTQLRIRIDADGRESELQTQLGNAARPELDRFAQNAAEALTLATVPLPDRPVGVGAQWIAESRMPLSGLDVIAYRSYRVKGIDGNRLHLTLDLKAYTASKDVQLQGVPKGATLNQVEVDGQGEMELVRGELLARKSDVQNRVVLVFEPPGGAQAPTQAGQPPGGMLTAQLQTQATLVRGDDLRAALKQ
jgi:hypothetical protein